MGGVESSWDGLHIAVVGSRDYPNLEAVRVFIRSLPRSAIVVSGGARGVDRTAELEAKSLGLATKIFRPDWEKKGMKAGILRNRRIVENSSIVVAFWDGTSRGTKNSIDLAMRFQKQLFVHTV